MININDYNREDLIASCLMEAAEVMSESYGAHGTMGKFLDARYDAVKAKNDAHDERIAKKRQMYNKAGYLDKAPAWASREEERRIVDAMKEDIRRRYIDPNRAHNYAKRDLGDKAEMMPYTASYDILKDADKRAKENAAKKAQVNKRINERAERARKAMGESAYDHLDFADAVLDILNDYDY